MQHFSHKLIALFLAITCMGAVQAGELTVADGTETHYNLPIHGAYCNYDFKSQIIYPSSLLATMTDSAIHSVSFYTEEATGTWGDAEVTINLAEVEQTSFDGKVFLTPDFTKVFEGTFELSNHILTYVFNEPYQYHGGNLLIEFILSKQGGTAPTHFYGISNSNSGLIGYGYGYPEDNRQLWSYLPKATFGYCRYDCNQPSGLTQTDIAGRSVSYFWTQGGSETSWQYICIPAATPVDWNSDQVITTTSTSATVENLEGLTQYKFYVRGICPESGYSPALYAQFKTPCAPVRTLPFEEGFESVAAKEMPACWDNSAAKDSYVFEGEDAYTGTKYLRIAQWSVMNTKTITLPEVETDIKKLNISFYYRTSTGSTDGNPVVGYINTSGTFVGLDTLPQVSVYTPYDLNLWEAGDDAVKIAISYVPGTDTYGWVNMDDFTVSLIPECTKPTDVHETEVTSSTATIAWTANSKEKAWQIQLSEDGENWGAEIPVNTNPYTLTDLNATTTYYVRVKAKCGPEDESDWSYAHEFRTICSTIVPPYMWTFENQTESEVPYCWDNSGSNTSPVTLVDGGVWTVYTYDGNKMIWMYNSGLSQGTALVNTPSIALPLEKPMVLEFDYSQRAGCGGFAVKISTDGGVSFSDLKKYEESAYGNYNAFDPGVFKGDTIDLSDYAGQTVILQFYAEPNQYLGAIFVDNVEIREPVSCRKPKNVSVSNIHDNTADVSWTEKGEATAWKIQTSLNRTDWSEEITADSNPHTLTGLEPDTKYYVRVKADCGGEWSTNPAAFKTECGASTMPFNEDFESNLTSCWDADEGWSLSNEDHVSGTQSMRSKSTNGISIKLPAVTLDDEAQFTLWHKSDEVSFWVYANYVSEQTNLATINHSAEWKKDTISLSQYTGQTVRLIIRSFASDYKSLYMDDLGIEYASVATPQNFLAMPGASRAILSWDAVEGAASYDIRWREKDAEPEAEWAAKNVKVTKDKLMGLTVGKTYEIQVRANASLKRYSDWTASAECTPVDCPTILSVSLDDKTYNSVVVSWTADAFGTWFVRYKTGSETTTATGIENMSFALKGLTTNAEYTIDVKPICASEDEWVPAGTYTPSYIAPDVTVSDITQSSASVSWEVFSGEKTWTLEYKKSADSEWTSLLVNTTPLQELTELIAGTAYEVRVTAGDKTSETVHFNTHSDYPTDIDTASSANDHLPATRKIIKNGQLLIIHDGNTFTILGEPLR